MRIGIVCYASVGGSGAVATELAHALALRGHEVHLVSSELPFRWRAGVPGSVVRARACARLSAVPRATIPARADQHARARIARAAARHPPRALRGAARDGGISRASDSERDAGRNAAAHRDDAARHGHHARRQRSVVRRRRRVLDRAVTRRDRGVEELASGHDRGARHQARDPRHPELPRLQRLHASARRRDSTAVACADAGRADRHARVQLQAGQTHRLRHRGVSPDAQAGADVAARPDRRWTGARRGGTARGRPWSRRPRRLRRRADGSRAVAVRREPIAPAVGSRELRSGRARGDGVQRAGNRVTSSVDCRRSSRTA